MGKKIRVCKKCCGFDVKLLVDRVGVDKCSIGCNGKCLKKYPELEGKACGFIDGEFVVCGNANDFLERLDALEDEMNEEAKKAEKSKKDKKDQKDKKDKKCKKKKKK